MCKTQTLALLVTDFNKCKPGKILYANACLLLQYIIKNPTKTWFNIYSFVHMNSHSPFFITAS